MNYAAIYSRVSLPGQTDNYSLDSQRRAMLKLAKERGFAVPAEFQITDPGMLGGELDRPGLTRIRDLARAGAISAVIVLDQDRWTRELSHLLLLGDEMEKAGVELIFVNGGTANQSPESQMLTQMKGVFSQYEKLKFKERSARGRREKLQQGFATPTRTAYGYRYEGKKLGKRGEWVINEHEAAGVRRMFALAEGGAKLLDIGRAIEAEGFMPRTAASWSKNTISGILANPCYTGAARFNRRRAAEPAPGRRRIAPKPGQSKKTSRVLRPQGEWIEVKVPAIVSVPQFEAVAGAMERSSQIRSGRPSKTIHLLRGLLKCGHCGAALHLNPCHGRPRYVCGAAVSRQVSGQGKCAATKSVSLAAMERATEDAVCWVLEDPKRIMATLKAQQPKAAGAAEGARIAAQIEKLKRREANSVRLLLDADLADNAQQIRDDLKRTKAERQMAEGRLAALRPAGGEYNLAKMAWLTLLLDGMAWRMKTKDQRRDIITKLVKRVVLHDGGEAEVQFAILDAEAAAGSDRNRSSDESVDSAGGIAAEGDRGSIVGGGIAGAVGTAVTGGEPGAFGDGRGVRRVPVGLDYEGAVVADSVGGESAFIEIDAGFADFAFHAGVDAGDELDIRAGSGIEGEPSGFVDDAERRGGDSGGVGRERAVAEGIGVGAGGAEFPAAVWRGVVCEKPAKFEDDRYRVSRDRFAGEVPAFAGVEWV